MKKIIASIAGVVCLLAMSVSVYAASGINANEQAILDELKKGVTVEGKTVNLPAEYINQAETYFKKDGVEITEAQKSNVVAKIDEAYKILKDEDESNLKDLSRGAKDNLIKLAEEAAAAVDLKLSYDNVTKTATIKDSEGNVVAKAENIVKVTGTDMTTVYAASAGVVLLLVACAAVAGKKKLFVR